MMRSAELRRLRLLLWYDLLCQEFDELRDRGGLSDYVDLLGREPVDDLFDDTTLVLTQLQNHPMRLVPGQCQVISRQVLARDAFESRRNSEEQCLDLRHHHKDLER